MGVSLPMGIVYEKGAHMKIAELRGVTAQGTEVRITNFDGDTYFHGKAKALPEWSLDLEVEFLGVYWNTLEVGIN